MRNVAGLSTSDAQKSSDLFLKCRYIDELTNGRGITFATGTPVSNSMTELYTMQRYLQHSTLMEKGFKHFDSWAATFGETTTSIELAPEGNGYRARTRFSRFFNLPELMNVFKEVADIKTADMLDLPTPKANYETIVVQPSEIQEEMVKSLSERAKAIHDGYVDPREDNMLKITSDGRKIGLDQRLMNELLPDDPNSKVNTCIGNVYKIWNETQEKRFTQLIFSDMSTPHYDGKFNIYDDIKTKLIQSGVPEKEIAFIHDAKTDIQKKEMFSKMRKGQIRVLIGSTPKLGSGTNVQDKLIALHDLDAPWRPSDLAQRAGRIVRQGNENEEVNIYRYVTEKSFDSYIFQMLENKQKFISQIMTSKTPVRSCEDIDSTALSFAEIKALCAGNPLIKEKTDLDLEIRKLRLLKSDYNSQHYKLQDNLHTRYPTTIKALEGNISGLNADMRTIKENTVLNDKGFSPMIIGKTVYSDKEKAGEELLKMCSKNNIVDSMKIGCYRGMDMFLSYDFINQKVNLTLRGKMDHKIELGDSVHGNITRINNVIDEIPDRIKRNETQVDNTHRQIENAKTEIEKPFAYEQELQEKVARLAEVDAELNIDKKDPELMDDEEQPEEQQEQPEPDEPEPQNGQDKTEKVEKQSDRLDRTAAKSEKPSILAFIKNYEQKQKSAAVQSAEQVKTTQTEVSV